MSIEQFLTIAARYRMVFLIVLDFVLITLAVVVGIVLIRKIISSYKEAHAVENRVTLRNKDYSKVDPARRADVIRRIIAAQAVDPAPNGYIIINDSGKDVYARSFTIDMMPKRTTFNTTFQPLLDFPSCTSSIFIEPISETEMSRKLDSQINILETEHYAAKGNTNRQRKLEGQYHETESWAEKVESGDEKFFNVGFLFTIYAEDVETLNKLSDLFKSAALGKGLGITSCYGVQAEAYESNMPLNKKISVKSRFIKSDTIKMHQMDKRSLSTVFNYTESSFTHKDGIPLGRDMFTGKPFVFDLYDPSHDGFTCVIAGKTGSGKSATIKMFCERALLHKYRFVAIDSQARKGTAEGEYAAIAELHNGVNFKISARSGNVLNIFDVQESKTYIKETATSGYEQRTLELSDKIVQVRNTIRTMMEFGNDKKVDVTLNTYINSVITNTVKAVYADFGIVEGDPDSLYEMGRTVSHGTLTSGLVPKKMPTFTDFYKKLLIARRDNRDKELASAYKIIVLGTADYVRELYYSDSTAHFFTAEEYENLPYGAETPTLKVYVNEDDCEEVVHAIHGIRPYYDGQSTLAISKTCPFTNIDISQLNDSEKIIARQIAIDFVNEQFIKRNSESIHSADKLVAIFDEAHENFVFEYARLTLDAAVRTARKRNAGIIFSTQTIAEFDLYPETRNILKQAAVKMVCKQDFSDKKHLMEKLNLTESQAYLITNYIGCPDDADEETKNKHRGEMCIIDTNKVIFCKVDFLKETEALAVETSAAELEKLINVR